MFVGPWRAGVARIDMEETASVVYASHAREVFGGDHAHLWRLEGLAARVVLGGLCLARVNGPAKSNPFYRTYESDAEFRESLRERRRRNELGDDQLQALLALDAAWVRSGEKLPEASATWRMAAMELQVYWKMDPRHKWAWEFCESRARRLERSE